MWVEKCDISTERSVERNRSITETMHFTTTITNRLKDLNENTNILWEWIGSINREVKMIEKEHMDILELKHTI